MGSSNVFGVPGWEARRGTARVLDGAAVATRVRENVARDVAAFTERTGRRPGLATILVGDEPAGAVYVGGKQKASREVGIEPYDCRLPADVSSAEVGIPSEAHSRYS